MSGQEMVDTLPPCMAVQDVLAKISVVDIGFWMQDAM